MPILPVYRHYIGVTGQNQPAFLASACRRNRHEQIGFGALSVISQPRTQPLILQPLCGIVNQRQIGIAAGGIESNQPRQPFDCIHGSKPLIKCNNDYNLKKEEHHARSPLSETFPPDRFRLLH